ncbi:copper chaperone PCu(A)C [Thalassomonas viridans]|uniref:Copper chaperone PCu(A)C n=1 Tax=Thalassomonas viridans TaxID=137584 RepID=A0AAF0C8P9_9GAMM|nr:copper chaperone PCu(A)C [Thalassomonas viridans]WDE04606.1 copper chaperone PCu(A)C [Thalassomonas viridans]
MKKIYPAFSLFICCFLTVCSFSVLSFTPGGAIAVDDGYVRETIPGTAISSAYMTITNNGDKALTLTGASSKRSPRIEIHEHTMSGGMMRMRQKASITIKAKESVTLQPSGLHLMVFDLPGPLKQGENMPVTLHFSGQQDVKVELPVRGLKKKNNHHH